MFASLSINMTELILIFLRLVFYHAICFILAIITLIL